MDSRTRRLGRRRTGEGSQLHSAEWGIPAAAMTAVAPEHPETHECRQFPTGRLPRDAEPRHDLAASYGTARPRQGLDLPLARRQALHTGIRRTNNVGGRTTRQIEISWLDPSPDREDHRSTD